MDRRRWFTIAEAADHFKIGKKTLYSLAARGRLPSGAILKIGRQIRINIKTIEDAAREAERK